MFDKGHSYSSVNTARSALSSIMVMNNNVTFGCQPLVIRFMKGIYNMRPPRPKYSNSWDVNVVLHFLRKLSPVNELSFKDLLHKLVMLVALITAQRVQTVHMLDIKMMVKDYNGYSFVFDKVIKTSRQGQKLPVLVLKAYPKDRRLCVVTVLKEYLKRRLLKVQSSETKLLVSYIVSTTNGVKSHKAVSKSTVSRWIKNVMARSGIDTSVFKPHSVRGASTSKAKEADYPIEDILKAGGWSNAGTFAQFYDRSGSGRRSFAETVLKM